MNRFFEIFTHISFRRYLVVGLLNTSMTLLIIYSVKWFLDFGDVSSNLIGYIVGLIFSFFLNNKWTFRSNKYSHFIYIKFALIFILAYFSNLLVVIICIDLIGLDSYFSHALGVPAYTVVGYLGNRYYVFK
jgi:putative flippase GtrA